jgi:hypothetical protein
MSVRCPNSQVINVISKTKDEEMIITLNIWLIPIVKLNARQVDVCNGRQESTTRTSWTANNAIPDSIIMNMICRKLVPPVGPKDSPTEVGLTSKNTLRILITIKVVIRAFTAMDKAKHVIINGSKISRL